MEVSKKIYIGNGATGKRRLNNIRKLAARFFGGSVSKLFNDALNKVYRLDSVTGEEVSEKDFLVAEATPPKYDHKPLRTK